MLTGKNTKFFTKKHQFLQEFSKIFDIFFNFVLQKKLKKLKILRKNIFWKFLEFFFLKKYEEKGKMGYNWFFGGVLIQKFADWPPTTPIQSHMESKIYHPVETCVYQHSVISCYLLSFTLLDLELWADPFILFNCIASFNMSETNFCPAKEIKRTLKWKKYFVNISLM